MEIPAAWVKELRDETDAPIMDCRRALQEAVSNLGSDKDFQEIKQAAKDILRQQGKATAVKKADRTTSNGRVAIARSGDAVAAVVMLCETDFVAKSDEFVQLTETIAKHFADNDPGDRPLDSVINGKSVADLISEAIGKIRENIQLGPVVRLVGETIGAYLHHDNAKAALVVLGPSGNGKQDIANKIGTQIVALSPEFINKDQIDADRLKKEIEINKQLALDAGKPADIAEKIAEGKVKKDFLQEVVLLEQPWYADTSKKVADVINETAKGVEILRFVRLEAGKEPIESRV